MEDTIRFQITDIASDDLVVKEPKKDPNTKKLVYEKDFVITLYGINEKGKRVVCHVRKFFPYFFVKIPNTWDEEKSKRFARNVCNEYKNDIEIRAFEMKAMKEFYGFHWSEERQEIQTYNFLKIGFKNHNSMKKSIQCFKDYHGEKYLSQEKLQEALKSRPYDRKNPYRYETEYEEWFDKSIMKTTAKNDSNLYESCIHPIVRFIHESGIDPTGWIKVENVDTGTRPCQGLFDNSLEFSCRSMGDITKLDINELSQYVIASFDIECDSSHGDFPQTRKFLKKLATDVFDSIRMIHEKTSGKDPQREDLIQNIEKHLYDIINLGFNKEFQVGLLMKEYILNQQVSDINEVYTKDNMKPNEESIKNISEMINIELCGELFAKTLKGSVRDKCINKIKNILVHNIRDKDNREITEIGDPVIQIGTVFHKYGAGKEETYRHIAVIGPTKNMPKEEICDDLKEYHITVEQCQDEAELIMAWVNQINERDPDFITGYNIFGFDFKYLQERAEICFPCNCRRWRGQTYHQNCRMRKFLNMGKIDSISARDHKSKLCRYVQKDLNSSALGDNSLNYIQMDGRILFDIQKEVQKSHQLESYKLDNVAAHFMRGKLKEIRNTIIATDIKTLKVGDYISFRTHSNIGEELHKGGKKFNIIDIANKELILSEALEIDISKYHKVEWCLNKDDITPQDIFDKHKMLGKNGAKARAEVAKYCIQDCELCIDLLLLLDIIPNNLAMANVSHVPASYIFLRGQGVRVTSVVAKTCNELKTRMPDLKKSPMMRDYVKMLKSGDSEEKVREQIIEDNSTFGKPKEWELDEWYEEAQAIFSGSKGMEGFEGAIVLDPTPGIYLDDPIAVMDYASLYPSSIIEKNCSHETQIEDMNLVEKLIEDKDYYKITYENWVYQLKGKGNTVEKIINPEETHKTCYFLTDKFMKEHNMDSKGIIPKVLEHLLQARRQTKKRMKAETDEFKYKVLDGLQLAYKVTANSVYGQLGARTSTIYKMNLAACTTSIGRSRINDASEGVIQWAEENGRGKPEVIYGDTDSIFVKFSRMKDGTLLQGKEALQESIDCGKEAGHYITELIHKKQGHNQQELEYEKTFWPFILISKKRYTGDKYESDIDDCKRTSMGIVLKRRDNAPIVKYVYGNIIEIIMIEKDFDKAKTWLINTLKKIRDGEFDMSYFVITKSLRGYYKNPQQIAHKVLADRMAERDPGNKPKSNDRIPYAYINLSQEILYDTENRYKSGKRKGKPRERSVLQGDRIEHIDYIKSQGLTVDYNFYITNQIMNPVKQVLDLHMDPKETEELFVS